MLGRLKFNIQPLVNEMLDQIPESVFQSETTTFFDPAMGGGQFLREVIARLRKYGHSDENIAARVFGTECDGFRVNYVKNKFKLPGTFWAGKLDDLEKLEMKFDVIMGNPPYQAATGESATIWDRFVDVALNCVTPGGYVSLIHPPSWRKPQHLLWNKLTKDRQLVYLNINSKSDGAKVFGAQTRFDYYVIHNTPAYGPTCIIDELNTEVKLDLAQFEFLPNAGISILNKIMSGTTKLKAVKTSEMHSQRPHVHAIESESVPFKQLRAMSNKGDIRLLFSSQPHTQQTAKKVIFSDSEYLIPFYDKDGEYGATQHGIYILVKNDKEGENLVKYLNSKLIQFIVKYTKWSNFQLEWKMLTYIDWPFADANVVDDKTVAMHFGLTQEEIDYVESTVK